MNISNVLRKINETLIWIILIFGLSLIMMFYTPSKEFSIRFLIPTFLVMACVYLVLVVIQLIFGVQEKDLDYFKRIISGIVGGFVVFFLTKIDFSSPTNIWLSIVSNFQLIIIVLLIIYIGHFFSKRVSRV